MCPRSRDAAALCAVILLLGLHVLIGGVRIAVDDTILSVEHVLVWPGVDPARRAPSALRWLGRQYRTPTDDSRTRPGTRIPIIGASSTRPIPHESTIPLFLLTSVSFERAHDGSINLTARTPTRVLRASWQLPDAADARLRRAVIEQVSERLESLGRRVQRETNAVEDLRVGLLTSV